jgi:hypothetical protein
MVFKMNSRTESRYAPMDRSSIPGFPIPMPRVNWLNYLPLFKDKKGDNVCYTFD